MDRAEQLSSYKHFNQRFEAFKSTINITSKQKSTPKIRRTSMSQANASLCLQDTVTWD